MAGNTDTSVIEPEQRALILAGGGMRLAYQGGCLLAFEEAGLHFKHVDGTSGGIFNTAMIASGLQSREICDRWRTLKLSKFLSPRMWFRYFRPFRMQGFTDADGIREVVFPHLGINIDRIRSNQDIVSTYNVCNFSQKTIEAIPGDKVQEDHLIAGVSLPLIMPALKVGEDWYTDGVWIKDANLLEAVKRGGKELWLIWAIGNTSPYYGGALNQYVHMIEMSANGALWEEFEQIKQIHQQESDPIRLHVIKPQYPLPLDPDLFFGCIDTRSLINMGYADAKRTLSERTEAGEAFDISATAMDSPGNRLSTYGSFINELLWKGKKENVAFHYYLRYSEYEERKGLEFYSSLSIGTIETPLFNHKITMDKEEIRVSASLLIEQESIDMLIAIPKPFALDWWIGLGFKDMALSMKQGGQEYLKGRLFQPIKYRLKSLFTTNVRTHLGHAGSQLKKYKMMKNLIAYEV